MAAAPFRGNLAMSSGNSTRKAVRRSDDGVIRFARSRTYAAIAATSASGAFTLRILALGEPGSERSLVFSDRQHHLPPPRMRYPRATSNECAIGDRQPCRLGETSNWDILNPRQDGLAED